MYVGILPKNTQWDWYIYLRLVNVYGKLVGKYASPKKSVWIGV